MNTYLLVALACTALFLATVRYAYRQHRMYDRLLYKTNARLRGAEQEREELARRLGAVARVLNCSVGGIGKRLSENVETAETVQRHAAQLFTQSKGLVYRLHANEQFLVDLYWAANYALDAEQSEATAAHFKAGRSQIFGVIYDAAQLVPPADRRPGSPTSLAWNDRQIAERQIQKMGYQALLEITAPVVADILVRYPAPALPLSCHSGAAPNDLLREGLSLDWHRQEMAAVLARQAQAARDAAFDFHAAGAVAAAEALYHWADACLEGTAAREKVRERWEQQALARG